MEEGAKTTDTEEQSTGEVVYTHGFTYHCPACNYDGYVDTNYWYPERGWQ